MSEPNAETIQSDPVGAARDCLSRRVPTREAATVRAVAMRARSWAADLASVQSWVRSGVGIDVWAGQAAAQFSAGLHGMSGDLSATQDRYAAYAAAFDDYATDLDGLVVLMQGARAILEAELERVQRAPAVALSVPAQSLGSQSSLRTSWPDPIAVDRAYSGLRGAVREFVALYGRYLDAAHRCTSRLMAADRADPGRDRTGWQAFSHAIAAAATLALPYAAALADPSAAHFSQALSVLGNELTILGIGLLFVCPPAGAACLAAAAALSAVQLAVDCYRRFGQHDAKVSNVDLAMDAVGALPVAVASARAGKVAGEAAKAARVTRSGSILERGATIVIRAARAGARECRAGLTAEIRLLQAVPVSYYRAPLKAHNGFAGLARRWAPKLVDVGGVAASVPSAPGLPDQQSTGAAGSGAGSQTGPDARRAADMPRRTSISTRHQ